MRGDALAWTSRSEHDIAFSQEIGANDGVPFKSGLLEIAREFSFISLFSRLDSATMRNSAHVAHVVLYWRVGSETLQPEVVVH